MLAESAVLKEFLSVARNLSDVNSEDYKSIQERILLDPGFSNNTDAG